VTDANPRVRERAYEALMNGASDRGRELVLDAIRGLSEQDEGVRQRLLSNAMSKGMDLPPDLLTDLVRGDGSEDMRLMALDVLATTAPPTTAKAAAEAALNDPSGAVRERAADILGQLRHP
jgi:HEAT repeat protein